MAHVPRYLVITQMFLPIKGGTAIWFAEVYRRISGKQTHIVTADAPGAAEYDATSPNSVHRLSLRRYGWLMPESLVIYLKLLSESLRLAFGHDLDAIHAGRVLPEGLVGWLVARLKRRPLLIYAHGEEITTWRQPLKLKAMVFTYRRADHIIANSEFTRDELIKLGVIPKRITIIYPGVDIERFQPGLEVLDLRKSIGLLEGQALILSVGRLQRRKGFDQVVRALPRLLQSGIDVHHVIIGIGEDWEYLTSLSQELGVASRVHLLGHISTEELPRWYNAADVFAMPNREINHDTEGFGLVFLEAAACDKPVLAGNVGGTGAAVVHDVTGLRVNGNCIEEVAVGLLKLLSDKTLAKKMGAKGYCRAHEGFSWEIVAKKSLQLSGIFESCSRSSYESRRKHP
jgi:phosphatidylinositol alpha-1,6-mannosyltransferase